MAEYYVNTDNTNNPNHNHEVHKEGCWRMPSSKLTLGNFTNAVPAVEKAKRYYYTDADGCVHCCPEAHHG